MLHEFISETKHRPRQYETAEDLEHISRKMLATMVPKFVDWKLVYRFVDSDLNSINFRAPDVLANYATIKNFDPEWLDQLLDHPENKSLIKENETVLHYIDNLQPIPEGKELYFFFLHGQKQKNLGEHLNYIFGNENTQEKARITHLIHTYEPIFDEQQLVEDIGTLLKRIQCGQCKKHMQKEKEKEEETSQEKEEEDESPPKVNVKTVVAKNWDNSYKNPVLEAFRADNGLSSRYPSEKLVKQLVVGSVVDSPKDHLKSIMGKYQNDIVISPDVKEKMDVDDLLVFVECIPDDQMKTLIEHPTIQGFYGRNKPETDREWIKMYIQSHLKNGTKIDSDIVQDLIK